MITIRQVDPSDKSVMKLINDLNAHLISLYPDESNHIDEPELYNDPQNFLFGLFEDSILKGIGGIKARAEFAEIKRIYVPEKYRGFGFGGLILGALERQADRLGLSQLFLETGIHQPEAQGLYKKMAYKNCEKFGEYDDDPLSVFFEKNLTASMGEGRNGIETMVLFSSRLNPGVEKEYSTVHAEMKSLVSQQPGLLRILSARNESGLGVSTSFWRSAEELKNWAVQTDHLRAQELGRTQFYQTYRTTKAEIQFS